MACYEVIVKNSVRKAVEPLPLDYRSRIAGIFDKLEMNATPYGAIKMVNSSCYRIRVGPYRIVYEIEFETKKINVVKVAHRREVYR
jgi:mRNA interferase RelE/StbE